MSLLSADLDFGVRFVSWNPSPSRGTLEVFAGWATGTGVLGCKVLASEALILSFDDSGLPLTVGAGKYVKHFRGCTAGYRRYTMYNESDVPWSGILNVFFG